MKKTDLRKQAEEKLSKRKKSPATNVKVDSLRMIYELEVHRIELEMQNEGLILAQAETEAALRQYTDLYDFAPVGYFTLMRDSAIQQVNLTGATLLGAERGKLLTRRLGLFAPLRSRPILSAFLEKVFAAGGEKQTCEIELLKGKTESFWAQIEATYDESDETCRAVMVDISARKQAEMELRESEESFHSLLDKSPDGIVLSDLSGFILMVNQRAAEMHGYEKPEDMLGAHVLSLIVPEDQNRTMEFAASLQSAGGNATMEYTILRRDEKTLPCEIHSSIIFDEHRQPQSVTSNIRDITARKQAEEQIAFQALLLSNVNDAVVASDAKFILTSWNHAAEQIYGWKAEEVIGKSGADILQTEFLTMSRSEGIQQLIETGEMFAEVTNLRKDGTRIFIENRTNALRDLNGKTLGYVSVNRNITERKLTENKLRDQAMLLDLANDAILVRNLESEIVFWNRGAEQTYGWTNAEALGNVSHDLLHTVFPVSLETVDQALLRENVWDGELTHTRRSGAQIIVTSRQVLQRDEHGQPIGILEINRDITERKQAENQLRKGQAFISAILELTPASIYTVSLDQRMTLVNRQWEQDTQIKRADAIGRSLDEIFPSALAQKYREDNLLVVNSGELLAVEEWAETPDGLRCYYTLKFPLRDSDGSVESVVGLSLDITERKQAEEALQESELFAKSTVDALSAQLAILDENGVILAVNRAWREFAEANSSGSTDLVYEGVNYLSVCETSSGPQSEEAADMAAGIHRVMSGEQAEFSLEYPCHSPTEKRWFNARVTRFAGSGARRIAVAHENITERKQADEALRAGEERLQFVTLATQDAVYDWDMLSGHVFRNEAYQKLFSPDEPVGTDQTWWEKQLFPDDRERIMASIGSVFGEKQKLWSGEYRFRRHDGNYAYVIDRGYIMYDGTGKAIRMIGAMTDFTERKQAEANLQSQNEYLGLLNNMTRVILLSNDFDATMQTLAVDMAKLIDADDCYVTRWDAENERTIPVVSTAKLEIPYSQTPFPLDERSMTKSVLLAGHSLTANDVFNSPHTSSNIARNYPSRSILGIPLIVGTNKLGAAIIAFNTPHDFTTQEIERAEHAGAQIAIALWNFQQSAEIQQSLKESNTLIEIARALGETEHTGSNTVLQFIVDSARELIPQAEQVVIHIVDQDENKLVPQATAGLSEEANDGSQIGMQMGVGVAGQVINDGIVINIADVHTDARFLRANDAPAFRSLLVAPVQSGRQQIGTISLQSRQAHAFSKKEENLLKALGIEAAIAIENTYLFESTQQRLKEVDALYKTSQGLATSLDPDQLINDTVILLQKNFGYYYVQVYLQDLINGDLILKMGSGEVGNHLLKNGYRLPRGTGIVGHVAETAVPFVTSNINGVVFFERNPLLPDTESEMAVPIKIERDVIGILDIQEKHPHRLTERDLKLMTAVADQLAVALQKANLYTDLQTALAQEQTMRSQLIQSERLALVGRLLASVSHELNNPMQAIQNALFLLKEEAGLSSQGKQDLDIVLSETERMTVLIERLHSAYRPIRITDFQPIQLNSLIEDVYALIGTHMRHKEIAFEFIPDADLPAIFGISDQIRQVALNLFLNAVEVMQPGGRLAVQTRNLIGQNEVLLSVMDSGPGIDPEFLPKIFDPFITSKHTGTGLGLTITRDIIEQHHGRIEAQNNPKGGAVFNIWLPLDGKG